MASITRSWLTTDKVSYFTAYHFLLSKFVLSSTPSVVFTSLLRLKILYKGLCVIRFNTGLDLEYLLSYLQSGRLEPSHEFAETTPCRNFKFNEALSLGWPMPSINPSWSSRVFLSVAISQRACFINVLPNPHDVLISLINLCYFSSYFHLLKCMSGIWTTMHKQKNNSHAPLS